MNTEKIMLHGGNVWQGGDPGKWLDYSANLRPEGTAGWARDCMAAALDDVCYYPALDMGAARAALAEYAGVGIDNILPTAGGIAAIDIACALADDRVLVMPPTFGEYVRRAHVHGKRTDIYVGEGSHAWGDFSDAVSIGMPDMYLREGDTLFLCNPNNPSGELLTRKNVLELYETVRSCGARLVVDEAFIDYCPENSVRDIAAQSDGELIVVASLTKILGVPGARLGFMVADAGTIKSAERLCVPWTMNCFASRIAQALPAHQEDIAHDRMLNVRRRTVLAGELVRLGIAIYPSGANFLLLRFDRPARDIAAKLRGEGILTRDCASFSVLSENHMRIAVKTCEENERFISALKRALAK